MQVSSVDLERACCGAAPEVSDAAAVAVPPPGGGPDRLILFAVLRPGSKLSEAALRETSQVTILLRCMQLGKKRAQLRMHVCGVPPVRKSSKGMRADDQL